MRTSIDGSIEIDVPASRAYEYWTRMEQFPRFIEAVESVKRLDEQRSVTYRVRLAARLTNSLFRNVALAILQHGSVETSGVSALGSEIVRLTEERLACMTPSSLSVSPPSTPPLPLVDFDRLAGEK